VHGPGAGMDSLLVGPSYVNREVGYILVLPLSFVVVIPVPEASYVNVVCPQEEFFIELHDMIAEMEEVIEL